MFARQLVKSFYKFSVRVRYAPSPTGPMHLGAVRTALFNYMFAKHNNGKFIVRIQDTDIERNVKGSQTEILEILDWFGISPNQSPKIGGQYGPYLQSQRLNIYKQIQNQLLRKGFAYPCFCQTQKFSKQNKNNKNSQKQGGYDGRCRKLTLQQVKQKIKNGQKYVVRLKSDFQELKARSFRDQIYGDVTSTNFDDFVLVKKNGYPTYHFANVIDDWKMKITHVIRGVEWLTNTSRHLYLYNILGATPPKFVHLPLIFTSDGKKLSKRDPTAPIINLKNKGYLPEAIINYTALLGFTPIVPQTQQKQLRQQKKKSQKQVIVKQHYSLNQLCQLFQLHKVNNSPIRSDQKKLNFFNRYYMKKTWKQGNPQFLSKLIDYLRNIFNLKPQSKQYSQQFLKQFVECTIQRVSNLQDFKQFGYFFNKVQLNNETTLKDIKKILGPDTVLKQINGKNKFIYTDQDLLQKNMKIIHNLRLIFDHVVPPWQYSQQKIAQNISKYLYDRKIIENEDVYHLLRLAVTGKKSGVNIVKTCYVLGQDRIRSDLQRLHDMIKDDGKTEEHL